MRPPLFPIAVAIVLTACGEVPQAPAASTPRLLTLEQLEKLSEAQVKLLTAEQLEALMQEAEADLKAGPSDTKLRAQAWPDYFETLGIATGIDYNTYLNAHYQRSSGPDWGDDGCSNPISIGRDIFNDNACRHHDFGYRNVSQFAVGRNPDVRKLVDERFLSNMNLKCELTFPRWFQIFEKRACQIKAAEYYVAVRNFGAPAYYEAPLRY